MFDKGPLNRTRSKRELLEDAKIQAAKGAVSSAAKQPTPTPIDRDMKMSVGASVAQGIVPDLKLREDWAPPTGVDEVEHENQAKERFKQAALSHQEKSPIKGDEGAPKDDVTVYTNAVRIAHAARCCFARKLRTRSAA